MKKVAGWTDSESKSTITVVQEVRPPSIPDDARVMTVLITHPPGSPGSPPHRVPGGPAFGYMLSGEMLFEIEGEAPRVLRAGDAFWGPGGDVIHYQDTNIRTDIPCSFVLIMLRESGKPMLERVTGQELEDRKKLRVTPTNFGAATTGHDTEDARAHEWRDATRELVLTAANASVAADPVQSHGSISITMTGNALSNELLLADTGNIPLTSAVDHADAHCHPMTVIPMRLDLLSDLPAIRVQARGVTEPMRLRLAVELTARNAHTDTTSVLTCEFDSVLLDARTPLAVLAFQLQQGQSHL
jgi:quercetin dioxygenase-like cupin family protein